jgi:hypothetical protein
MTAETFQLTLVSGVEKSHNGICGKARCFQHRASLATNDWIGVAMDTKIVYPQSAHSALTNKSKHNLNKMFWGVSR